MTLGGGPGRDGILQAWQRVSLAELIEETFGIAGVRLTARSDDRDALGELTTVIGGRGSSGGGYSAPRSCAVTIRSRGGPAGWGHVEFEAPDPALHDPNDIRLALESPDFPFTEVPSGGDSWLTLGLAGQTDTILSLKGSHCLVPLTAHWRNTVALFLFNRMLRARTDAIFFHASSVDIGGRGILLVGPKGRGKSTTALALAARGHPLLGDDTACYLPETRELLPCRRAVGIRPGPRARAVSQALALAGRDAAKEPSQTLRIDVGELLDTPDPAPVPLAAVVFLEGFGDEPRLARVRPTRDEVAKLQPWVASLVNASPARRVFEMTQLLGAVEVYRLTAGDPDDTARLLEDALDTR